MRVDDSVPYDSLGWRRIGGQIGGRIGGSNPNEQLLGVPIEKRCEV